VGYINAGTVEFLVDGPRFYFLEMNTRIQVEHPVTETVTGLDLVELQLRVARGEPIPFKQGEVRFSGHAVEFRINAEDSCNGFRPAGGVLRRIRRPEFPFVREDTGYAEGDEISLFYDGLISKLVIKGDDRADAIAKSREVLSRYTILGVPTSLDYDLWATENGMFATGSVDIGFVEREFTSTCIRDLRARRVKDPAHCEPIGGAEMKNCYEYTSKKYNTTYTIEVVHKSDGYFLAIPLDNKGRRARNKNCRMSNGLPTVMRSLIDEVLETQTPAQVFEQ
jgi:acetyl/propionyl-CoA carboxylase alpha subunit